MKTMNTKKLAALLLALVMMVSVFAGCSSSESAAPAAEASEGTATIKLGGIGPLTGGAAIYGNAHKNGMEIAVEEVNALGGIQFEMNFQDDEHDPEKSVNAYNNLMDWDMDILVGPTTTNPAIAVSSEAYEDRIFLFTPSASSPNVLGGQADENGNISIARKDNAYQLCFSDPNQGTASAQYIAEQGLGSKIAVIYKNDDAYSTGIYNKFAAESEALGLEIVSVTTFTESTANDFSVQLNDAKNAGADLIFLPIYYTPASLILTQADAMEYDVKFFGVDGMDGILTLEGFDTSLAEGVMLLTPFNADDEDDATAAFVAKYQERYGEIPNQFAADAYDCIYALYEAINIAGLTAENTPEEMCEALIDVFSGDFTIDGLTGIGMDWTESGEVTKPPKGMIIENGAYVGM